MMGTILNVGGIVAGGIIGLVRTETLTRGQEMSFKIALGLSTIMIGLYSTWHSFNGSLLQILKQLVIIVAALSVGRLTGQVLHLQKLSNHLGRLARTNLSTADPDSRHRFDTGFKTCTILFCAAPLGLVGAVQDGLSGYAYPLAIKAVIDALAAMGFVVIFGWGVLLAAIPVLALQGSIALACKFLLAPALAPALINSVNAVGGLLVFCVALVVFEMKRFELANYLPSLAVAPLLTWIWR